MDALAAEYVLGVLPLDDRTAAQARIKADPGFAARVAAWETRLAPMNADFPEVPAPNLLPALEARLFPPAPRPRRFGWLHMGGALAALALAALVLLWPRAPSPETTLIATLAAEAQPLQFEARFSAATETLTLLRVAGTPPPAGQDLQLWLIGPDGTPLSLGLVQQAETVVTGAGLLPGLVLAVSLEPQGGSPTGLPTGPVLVTGILTEG